jgi:hypothetical protein
MLVPKAAMHENDFAPSDKDEVWPSRQVAAVKPEAVAQFVCHAPDKNFRSCVF